MKKLKFLSISVLLSSLILFAACNNDDAPNGVLNFKAKIDGTDWAGSGNSLVLSISNMTTTTIGAGKADNSAFAIVLNSATTGTYNLANIASFTDANQVVYTSTSGTMTITKFETDKISGTFSFSAKQAIGGSATIEVTNGEFTDVKVTR
jgi:hypothetical protein